MTSRDFCFWLQGFFELNETDQISGEQADKIRNHLNLVFKHEIDPSIDNGDSNLKKILAETHSGEKLDFDKDLLIRC